MASYSNTMPVAVPRPGQQASYGAPIHNHAQIPIHGHSAPAGTFAPGTKIQVGNHRVVIQKYLSEGGFAHVYLVKLPRPVDGTDLAVLKRVAVPDKETLRGMRTEVETMKRLKGHETIVTYIDSHASEIKGGSGYEVFLLMEYCNGGGLIDFMNTRLQHRLTEPEILNIFSDVAEGVACMHYLKPPLLHRDLKVENVLITVNGTNMKFKLCDFGSAAPPRPAPQTVVECRLIDEDIQRHTTLQYRSPEMIDVYRKQPIDEKSDIWALGVLLYKLCYYTTPFEEQGQLAILNASFRFPSYPIFSDRLKQLIASMLREDLRSRPNIYQVLRESCRMQGREVPIHDIYSGQLQSETKRSENQATAGKEGRGTPGIGAVYSPPQQPQTQALPDITPMRRGRPTVSSQSAPKQPAKPSPSPARITSGDPFAALDSKTGPGTEADELSSRFPTLDQFSLLHDQGSKFDFDSPTSPADPQKHISQRVTDHLVEGAFIRPQVTVGTAPTDQRQSTDLSRVKSVTAVTELRKSSPPPGLVNKPASAPLKQPSEMSRASAIISSNPELQAISSPPPQTPQDTLSRPSMVSTGTMTGTPPPEKQTRDYPPIHRFPPADQNRPASLPRQQEPIGTGQKRPELGYALRPTPTPRIDSIQPSPAHARHSSSSRPSLESGRPSAEQLEPLSKASVTGGRPRPVSTYLESDMDYLREREAAPRPLRSPSYSPNLLGNASSPRLEPQDETAIESNVDFLRSMEDSDTKKKDKVTKQHTKRSSLTSLSGTKNILAGRFGDAFKRFETTPSGSGARTPSPLKDMERHDLTPIAGSEATDGRSDDGHLGEPEMTPEMRRELELQALAEEERRVEAAAAEYKQRMAARDGGGPSGSLPKSIGGVSRAVSIQNRVQNLLDESQKSSQQVQRTASGYGKFSDAAAAKSRVEKQVPEVPPKNFTGGRGTTPLKPVSTSTDAAAIARGRAQPDPSSPVKPTLPPKPTHLNKLPTGNARARSPPKAASTQRPPGPEHRSSSEHLAGVGLPGRPILDMSFKEKEDYIQDFAKRFPSLSSIEMVERDLDAEAENRGRR
ncbi:Actin-regulating kinase 1 [Daldinia childiae]|uniref:Actin-regulating kinase 1 n=1 Tax=Daldinia childiae TaxID=326645 RepID=UPI001447148B|nr:Actin-regulating kinase 1 [Daldinia childiae]KAF3063653.1 Actin-regulating kinase 1 [Daldinia childiae]